MVFYCLHSYSRLCKTSSCALSIKGLFYESYEREKYIKNHTKIFIKNKITKNYPMDLCEASLKLGTESHQGLARSN